MARRPSRLIAPVLAALLLSGFVSLVTSPVAVVAAPQPDPVPRRWQFDIQPGPLRATVIDVADQGPLPFLYMTYTVTNLSDEDRYLAPLFEIATDEGDIARSGRGVPAEAYAKLIERVGNPFLQDEVSIQGSLRRGREYAREGLVMWPATDLAVDEIVVYGAGFSGETRSITRPDTGETVVLRKTISMRHAVPGTLEPSLNPTLMRTETRWILR